MFVGWQKIIITLTAVAITAAITTPSVWAQSVSPPPSPGSVITPIDKPVVQPSITREPSITSGDEEKFNPPAYSKKIQVDQFVLIGNSLFDDEILLGEIADYVDTAITLDQIYQAADRIQQFYRAQGYLLTSVYVPAQKISSGTVRLEIIEGRLEGLQLEGELKSYKSKFLLSQLDDLKLGEVITSPELEKEVLLLNDLPGLSARAVILPGSEYGTSTITIIADEDRSQSTIRLNNYGRVSLGEARIEAGWLYANPFFQGDQLNLSAIVSEDARLLFVRADYDALINKSGTRVGIGASAFDYEVDTEELNLGGLDISGDGANLRLLVSHPLLRKQRNRLDFIAVYRRDETNEDINQIIKTESIKVLDLTLQWQPTHANGSVSRAFFTFSSNFENNSDGSKDDALKDKFTIDYSYHTLFAKTWFALLRANLVFASDPLPDVERYRLGGPNSVRAYPSAEAAGDEGELFSVDIGKRFRLSGTTLLIAKLFADTGKVTRFSRLNVGPSEEKLAGYGAGILVDFAGRHTIEFEVVTPTTDRVSSDGRDTRGWFNYAAHF